MPAAVLAYGLINCHLRESQLIDHVYISVTDIDRSLAFYLDALQPLGWSAFGNYEAASGPEGVPDLYGIGDDGSAQTFVDSSG